MPRNPNANGNRNHGRTHTNGIHLTPSIRPSAPMTIRLEGNRPVTAAGGKHRGDRRDTSPLYTGNVKHASRGSNPRPDVSTRKR